MINWPRMPDLKGFEGMADHIGLAAYYRMEELMDTSAPERPQLLKTLAAQKPGRARPLRRTLDAKALPAGTELKRTAHFKEIDIFATFEDNEAVAGIGKVLRPCQEAVNLFRETLRGGK